MLTKKFFDPSMLSPDPGICLSAEDRFLVTCSGMRATQGEIERALIPGLDWEYILENAIHHRVGPLLYNNMRKVGKSLVPQETMGELRKTYNQVLAHNISALSELREVLERLSDIQAEVVLLKGAALAETVYPDIALRSFTDIDLLIRKDDLEKVGRTFLQLGYGTSWEYRPKFTQEFATELHYVKQDGMAIDFHWHIVGLPHSRYIEVEPFWENAVPVNIEGSDILILSPEYLLFHLCLHASKERCSLLFWLVDISEVIHHYDETLDWGLFLEKIERYRVHPLIQHVLRLVKEFFSPPIPDAVLEQLSHHKASSFEDRLLESLADPNITGVKEDLAIFLALQGIMTRVRYLYGKFLPGRDFMQKRSSSKSVCGSYCSRAIHGLLAGTKTLLQVCTNCRIRE